MKLEGEVGKIENNIAQIVFTIKKDKFVECYVPVELLKSIGADFEGACITLIKDKRIPYWARKNKEMEKVLKSLEKIRRV